MEYKHCIRCDSKMSRLFWASGKEEEAIPLHFGGRCLEGSHGEMEKNDPSSLIALCEGELTDIQTAFRADPGLRISHAGSECGAQGGQ